MTRALRKALRAPSVAALALLPLATVTCRRQEDPGARASLEEATVTAEVRSRILLHPGLDSLPLAVRTSGGTVRITGVVRDSTQPFAIRAIAERVRGARRVELELRVEPPPRDSTAADSAATARHPTPPAAPRPPREERAAPDTSSAPRDSLPSLDEAG